MATIAPSDMNNSLHIESAAYLPETGLNINPSMLSLNLSMMSDHMEIKTIKGQ